MEHDTVLILIFILEKEVVILHFSSYQQNNYVLLYNVGSNNFGKCYLKLLSFISGRIAVILNTTSLFSFLVK
jgi:hypothetical protein